MKKIIEEAQEFKRRIIFELDAYIKKMEDIDEHQKKLSAMINRNATDSTSESLVSVKRLCEIFPSFKIGTIRNLMFNDEWEFRKDCVRKMGEKNVMIDVKGFEAWVQKPKHPHQRHSWQIKK